MSHPLFEVSNRFRIIKINITTQSSFLTTTFRLKHSRSSTVIMPWIRFHISIFEISFLQEILKGFFISSPENTIPCPEPSFNITFFQITPHCFPIRITYRISNKIHIFVRSLTLIIMAPEPRINPICVNRIIVCYNFINTAHRFILIGITTIQDSESPRRW